MTTTTLPSAARTTVDAPRRSWIRIVGWIVTALPAVVTVLLAIFGSALAPHQVDEIVGPPYVEGGEGLVWGTDHLGHDVLSVCLTGARGIVLLPVLAVLVGTMVGVPLGLLAGWRAGWVGRVLTVVTQLLLILPPLLIVLIVLDAAPTTVAVVVVVGLLGSVSSIRYLRAASARAAASGFVEHAMALGESRTAVVFRELMPALVGPILGDAGLRLVGSIYLIASLSFLGLLPLDEQNWAASVAANTDAGGLNTAALLVPGLCIVAFAISVNLLADRFAARQRSGR